MGRDFESFLDEVRSGVDNFEDDRATSLIVVVGFLNIDDVILLKAYVVAGVRMYLKLFQYPKLLMCSQ